MQAAFVIKFIRHFKLLLKYTSMISWCKEWQFLAIRWIYLASRDNSLLSAIVSIILEPAWKTFFLLEVFHSSFSLNWLFILRFFCIMEIDFLINQMIFFFFWPPLRYHGKMFLYSFILFVLISFFAYDLFCEANVLIVNWPL